MKIFWILRDQQLSFIGFSNIIRSRYSWVLSTAHVVLSQTMWYLSQLNISSMFIRKRSYSDDRPVDGMGYPDIYQTFKERQVTSNDTFCFMNRYERKILLMFQSQGKTAKHPYTGASKKNPTMILYDTKRAGEVVKCRTVEALPHLKSWGRSFACGKKTCLAVIFDAKVCTF